MHVDRIREKDIERRVLESYSNFWGEGVKDGFQIISLYGKSLSGKGNQLVMDEYLVKNSNNSADQMKNQSIHDESEIVSKKKFRNPYYQSPELSISTKCGYIIRLIHYT